MSGSAIRLSRGYVTESDRFGGRAESWVHFNCVEMEEPRKTQSSAIKKNKSDSILDLFYCLCLVKLVLYFLGEKKSCL